MDILEKIRVEYGCGQILQGESVQAIEYMETVQAQLGILCRRMIQSSWMDQNWKEDLGVDVPLKRDSKDISSRSHVPTYMKIRMEKENQRSQLGTPAKNYTCLDYEVLIVG